MLDIFTSPDPDIFAEINSDPLGLRVIWTHYGQRIFGSRITTVATDLRNFTLNLFHHWVIKTYQEEFPSVVLDVKDKFQDLNTTEKFVDGIIIFLEDIWVHSMFRNSSVNENLDQDGILGSFKAQKIKPNEPVEIEISPWKGLLVRQRGLGVNGRYKGPFVNMNLFESSYAYNFEKWSEVNKFFTSYDKYNKLRVELHKKLNHLFKRNTTKTNWGDIEMDGIHSLYKEGFGRYSSIPSSIESLWVELLELDRGAAKLIYEQLKELKEQNDGGVLPPKFILQAAYNTGVSANGSHEDIKKINDIILLEPFLIWATCYFECIQYVKHKKLGDVTEYIQDKLNDFRSAILSDVNKLVSEDSAPYRLKKLVDVFKHSEDETATMLRLEKYHKELMGERNALPWLSINASQGIINHSIPLVSEPREFDQEDYIHNYYLYSIQVFFRGVTSINNEVISAN